MVIWHKFIVFTIPRMAGESDDIFSFPFLLQFMQDPLNLNSPHWSGTLFRENSLIHTDMYACTHTHAHF